MRTPVVWAEESFRALKKCDVIGTHAKRFGPPRLETHNDRFRALALTVVSQQLSGKAAESIFAKLENTVRKIEPQRILAASEETLRSAGLSGAKARTLKAISEAALDGLDLKRAEEWSDEELRSRLCEIKGIGPWTAEMFSMFCLGRPDVCSPGDLGLRKGLRLVYGLEGVPDPKVCEGLFERWRPWRTAASWYLWRVLEGENAAW